MFCLKPRYLLGSCSRFHSPKQPSILNKTEKNLSIKLEDLNHTHLISSSPLSETSQNNSVMASCENPVGRDEDEPMHVEDSDSD
ncbi:hypothetical protein Bca4012_041771 [Brassica carinata]